MKNKIKSLWAQLKKWTQTSWEWLVWKIYELQNLRVVFYIIVLVVALAWGFAR